MLHRRSQQWEFSGGALQFYHDKARCVDLPGNDATNGNQLQLWECTGAPQQEWTYDAKFNTIWLASGAQQGSKCMDLTNGGLKDGTAVGIWDCLGEDRQAWEYDAAAVAEVVV